MMYIQSQYDYHEITELLDMYSPMKATKKAYNTAPTLKNNPDMLCPMLKLLIELTTIKQHK